MSTTSTNLNFKTETQQSVWGPGASTDLSVDTGDLMVWDPARSTTHLGVDARPLFGFEADFYLDVKLGLVAYASLGSTGGFDSSFDLTVQVGHPSAVVSGPGRTMVFDFTNYTLGSSSIESQGFDLGSAKAGLKLVIEAAAGVENIRLFPALRWRRYRR